MIKASLANHDPVDIYDYFKKVYGTISMLVKKNQVILNFENSQTAAQLLTSPRKIYIRGLPLQIYPFDHVQPQNTVSVNFGSQNHNLSKIQTELSHFFDESTEDVAKELLQQTNSLSKIFNIKIKRIGETYLKKIKQLKQTYNEDTYPQKVVQLNQYYTNQLKKNKKSCFGPFNNLLNNFQQFGFSNQIDLEPDFQIRDVPTFNVQKQIISSKFTEYLTYNVKEQGKPKMKRLCRLNEQDFISTQINQSSQSTRGYLKIFRKRQVAPKYSIEISQGPYSLLCLDNYILAGDYKGFIHFIDTESQNSIEISNKLTSGMIFDMQKYQTLRNNSSILTLLSNQTSAKIRVYEIEKENITHEVRSLTFNPLGQVICEGLTMALQCLGNGQFAYGTKSQTFICSSLLDTRNCYKQKIIHQQNVMKIKKMNENLLLQATSNQIGISDLRTMTFTQSHYLDAGLATIQQISEHYIFYGGQNGSVGVADLRQPGSFAWTHPGAGGGKKVADLLRMGDSVISCDSAGIVCEWKNEQ